MKFKSPEERAREQQAAREVAGDLQSQFRARGVFDGMLPEDTSPVADTMIGACFFVKHAGYTVAVTVCVQDEDGPVHAGPGPRRGT